MSWISSGGQWLFGSSEQFVMTVVPFWVKAPNYNVLSLSGCFFEMYQFKLTCEESMRTTCTLFPPLHSLLKSKSAGKTSGASESPSSNSFPTVKDKNLTLEQTKSFQFN